MSPRHLARLSVCALALASSAHAATLNGRITGPGGAGVYPLDIDVYDNRSGAAVTVSGDSTNANGDYSITVPSGRYDLVFQPHPSLHLFDDRRNGINVTTTVTTNRTLVAGRYVSGRIVGPDGVGVPNVNLNFFDPATGDAVTQVQGDLTNATGDFQAMVLPGLWDIEIVPNIATRKVPRLYASVNVTSTDAALGLIPVAAGHLVTCSVSDASLFPISGADLDVLPAGSSSKLFTPGDNTAATGLVSFVVPPGVYDFIASPPGVLPYATCTARAIVVNADMALPNLVLPPGFALSGHSVTSGGVPVAGVDVDVDSLPLKRRLDTPNDVTNATGNVSVLVPAHKFRVTFAPTVATRLLPVVFDSLQITGATPLGNVVHLAGHWVNVNVTENFTGLPVEDVDLEFIEPATGKTFMTVEDVTGRTGTCRVVTDSRLFTLVLHSPAAGLNDVTITNFRTLNDTTINVSLTYNAAGVGDGAASGLALSAPWPNPARAGVHTSIQSALPVEAELSAWDLAGRRVATVFQGRVLGRHAVQWDARDERGAPVAPGVYLLRLSDGRTTTSRRVAVMR